MTILTREQIQDIVDANWFGLHDLPDSFIDLLETAWAYHDLKEAQETPLIPCDCCEGGRWETECCNGAYGCSCRGQRIDMGPCNVCHGTGWRRPDADTMANVRTIQGMCYIGSGPIY